MCGIAGILPSRQMDPEVLNRWIRRMTAKIVHRGPDEEGIHTTADVALGMRRLSIIDVAHGQQPMFEADGRYAVVFNGEIYNYRQVRSELEQRGRRFTTNCDTEVVLAAYVAFGVAGFQKLEGMFSIAIWDAAEKRLVLSRDWLGQKSLYWTKCALGFAFASEIKALLELPGVERKLDVATLSDYMTLRYLPGTATFFTGISKLGAAHVMQCTAGNQTVTRLWTPAYEPKAAGSEAKLLDEFDALMKTVVGEHLMSEVPLGTFLSGGIDSSLVTAYAAQQSREPVRTFSIGVNQDSQSELPWAKMVADRYKTRHFETIVEPDLAALAPRMVASMEEPVDPFACGVYVVSEVAAKHVTVALGGDGGDELFAGYDRYKGQELAEYYSHVPAFVRHKLLRPIFRSIPDSFGYNSITNKLRWLDQISDSSGFERYADSAAFLRFPHWRKSALMTEQVWKDIGRKASEKLLENYFSDGCASAFLDRMLHTDFMTRLADHQLPIADKMSMAHSLELRNPFLDRRIAEFAMRIPAGLKLKSRRIKYFTRKLGERYLPKELLYRPKQGFGFPLALWLRGELSPLITRVAEESRLAQAGIFRAEEMKRLVGEHLSGKMDHNYRLWMLFNIELFWRHYIESESVASLEDWIASTRNPRPAARVVNA
jgi:asparagine synthase (glutamine-hydrolysing)